MDREALVPGGTYRHPYEGVVIFVATDDTLRDSRTHTPIGVLVRCSDGETVLTSADSLAEMDR